jgi:alpha-L-rhamnosidase
MKTKLLIGCTFISQLLFAQIKVVQPLTASLVNPIATNTATPTFSWQLQSTQRAIVQTGYQIIAASTPQNLANNIGDLWNSGMVYSNSSLRVTYAGKALSSGAPCYWKVKVITNKGTSDFSPASFFRVGLLQASDWKATWIGYDKASTFDSISQFSRLSARYFRKEFVVNKIVKNATVYIVGLGMYELFVNGKKVGDQVLAPAPTDYRKSVLYNAFDVTQQIKNGGNAIAAVLGNGRFFTMRQDYKPKKINTFGYPKMRLQLRIEYANGQNEWVVSDGSWKLCVDGPIRSNNEYDGEEYDATKALKGWANIGFNDSKWLTPELVDAPSGRISAQPNEPMKVMQTFKPISIKKVGDKYILDAGQNLAGWLQIKVHGKRGQQVKMKFAESLQQDSKLYLANLRDAKVTDVYTLSGEGIETWHPQFVYHGFRYVEVSGLTYTPSLQDFEIQVVYDDLKNTSTFATSNPVINQVYKNAWWGIASNYKGMPVDCPQRNERQPWLGDRATGAHGESFLFANQNLYEKWLQDIEESQTPEGAIPDVAPAFWNYYSDNITWPGVYILVADMLYKQYGNTQAIRKHYPSMKKWMYYMKAKYMKDNLIGKDKYGDWCVPPESLELIHAKDSTLNTSGELIATAYYFHLLDLMQNFAAVSGSPEDVDAFKNLAANIKIAFNNKFYNASKKYYANNSITSNLLPIYFGLTPDQLKEAVFNQVYNKIKIDNHMHISTGVIGTQWLLRTLSQFKRSDIAYTLASNDTYPSWGYMAKQGATTIWELWNGNTANPQMNSQNHVMLLGDLLIWLTENLAGIQTDPNEVGFQKIIMKPDFVDELQFVNASYTSVQGKITSEWKKGVGNIDWHIVIPANTKATIAIPASAKEAVFESGHVAATATGVKFIKMENGAAVFEVGSGDYHFISNLHYKAGIVKDAFIFERSSFPESHASTIAETPKGLISAWFGGTKEGYKDVCIWTSNYNNGVWSAPKKIAEGIIDDSTRHPCYNPVLYQVPGGDLLLFYKIGPNVAGWKGYMIRSSDDGATWSKRETLPDGFLGPIKNKPELINNVLICGSSTEKTGWKVHFEYTKDWGKTWTKSEDINDGKIISAIQPSILKYKDGRLQILSRSRNTTLNQSWSTDNGITWSPMTASNLPNNNSGTDAVTLQDGRQLLVYNHAVPNASWVNGKGPRTPLNVAISEDGINWNAAVVLEDSPVSQYSYPSVIQTKDGLVHIVYTWRRERIKHVILDPKKLQTKKIVNGVWPAPIRNFGSTINEE